MKKLWIALSLLAAGLPAMAQMTPVGLWQNLDDKTGEAKAEIRITEQGGALSGRIERSLAKPELQKPTCTECPGDRKDQPMIGLEIVRGGQKAEGKDVWEGGRILDPENGKEYKASFTPVEGGRKLEVRGYLGPFWRTQTWIRR